MADRTLTVKLIGDGASVNKMFDAAGKSAEDFEKKSSKLGKALGGVMDVAKIAGGVALGGFITQAPGFLIGAAKAAAEDEAATARLNQTLKNHVDLVIQDSSALGELQGDVEERIKAAQKLGVSDDDYRNTLQSLLVATDDYGEATKRTSLAMDLSKGSGISLAAAAKMLGKIDAENVQGLKRLGIVLDDTATEADALAAVQARYGGQAAAFAKTTAGQFEQAKLAIGELVEGIGGALLPVFTKLATVLAANLPKIQEFVGAMGEKFAAIVAPAVEKVAAEVTKLGRQLMEVLVPAAEKVWAKLSQIDMEDVAAQWAKVEPIVTTVSKLFKELGEDILVELWEGIKPIAETVKNELLPALRDLEPVLKPLAIFAVAMAVGPLYLLLQAFKFLIPVISDIVNIHLKVLSKEIELTAAVVEKLAPVFQAMAEAVSKWVTETLVPAVKKIHETVDEWVGKAIQFVKDHWDEIRGVIEPALIALNTIIDTQLKVMSTAFDTAWKVITGALAAFKALFTGDFGKFKDEIVGIAGDLKDGVVQAFTDMFTGVGELAGTAWTAANKVGGQLLEGLKDALSSGASIAGDIGQAVLAAVKSAVNSGVIGRINRALEFSFDTHIPGVGSISINAPDIGYLEKGTDNWRGGPAVVGEKGFEILDLPRGSRVFDHEQSKRMLGAGVTNVFHIHGDWKADTQSGARQTVSNLAYLIDRKWRMSGNAR